MQNRPNNNPELVKFFDQQTPGWFMTYGISLVSIPVVGFTLASTIAANHPILSKLALLISILDIAEPFYANYYEKPGPFMKTTSVMHRAGTNAYHTFFGAKPAASTVNPALNTPAITSKKPG